MVLLYLHLIKIINNYVNILLYTGMSLIVFGFALFLYSEHKKRKAEIEECRQERLHQSFIKEKNDRAR